METKPKKNKQQKNFYLTEEARRLLESISEKMGINEGAVIELMIREKAEREGIKH